jgi:hypothetical protein
MRFVVAAMISWWSDYGSFDLLILSLMSGFVVCVLAI